MEGVYIYFIGGMTHLWVNLQFFENDFSRYKIMRKIDCARFWSVKTSPWPGFWENLCFLALKKPSFSVKNHEFFPETGSEWGFHASKMCAIDFLHNFVPRKVMLWKIFGDYIQMVPSLYDQWHRQTLNGYGCWFWTKRKRF